MITLAKRGDLSARRAVVAPFPNEPLVVTKLFDEIAPKYADRTSGYTRIVKIGLRARRRGPDRPDRTGLEHAPTRTARDETARALPGHGRIRRHGVRRLPGPAGIRTVQGELEAALARLSDGVRQPVDGAGRTDAGVHAAGQVIAFTYPGRLSAEALGRALNGAPAAGRRDPRRPTSAGRVPSPLRGAVPGVPLHRLERAAQPAPRAHGARGAGPAGRRRDGASRDGLRGPARLQRLRRRRTERRSGPFTRSGSGGQGSLVTIDVRADAFLRGMVRRIVAVLLEVGHGKMTEAAVRAALAAGTPALDGAAAPARGLCLRRVVLGRRPADGRTKNGDDRRTMSDEDLHGPRERDRAALVRRRCGGRDARPPRVADRARPRGQAQADVHAEPRFAATTSSSSTRRGSR